MKVKDEKEVRKVKKEEEVIDMSKPKEKVEDRKEENLSENKIISVVEPIVEKKTNPAKILVFIIVLITFTVSGLLSYFFLFPQNIPEGKKTDRIKITPTLKPKITPETTPIMTLKRDSISMIVLNGTQTAGLAADTKNYLEKLGYKNVQIGNADSEDYEQVQISLKPEYQEYFPLLVKDLKSKYEIASQSGKLDKTETTDVKIILGQN